MDNGDRPPPSLVSPNGGMMASSSEETRRKNNHQQQHQGHQQASSSRSSSRSRNSPGVVYEPLELEELHARPSVRQQLLDDNSGRSRGSRRFGGGGRRSTAFFDQICHMVKLFVELNPVISTVILFGMVGIFFYLLASAGRSGPRPHRIGHDYSRIDLDFNFKASQLSHWCLVGDDDSCECEDFIDPVGRPQSHGWVQAQRANVRRIDLSKQYDVVFLGDETTEIWNGKWLDLPMYADPMIQGRKTAEFWNKTFTKEGGGNFEGLALGVAGDSSSNLLWRIQHGGEAPSALTPKVWWILIGTNDLARGGCSEEATTLGILRTAEEIHHSHPDAVIVMQGILPRSKDWNGFLNSAPNHGARPDAQVARPGHHFPSTRHRPPDVALWPSIERINKQLELFCANHEHLVYFDASKLFLGSVGNEYYRDKQLQIIPTLMPDYVHPSPTGMKIMGKAMARELNRIIYNHDETNDIEEKVSGSYESGT